MRPPVSSSVPVTSSVPAPASVPDASRLAPAAGTVAPCGMATVAPVISTSPSRSAPCASVHVPATKRTLPAVAPAPGPKWPVDGVRLPPRSSSGPLSARTVPVLSSAGYSEIGPAPVAVRLMTPPGATEIAVGATPRSSMRVPAVLSSSVPFTSSTRPSSSAVTAVWSMRPPGSIVVVPAPLIVPPDHTSVPAIDIAPGRIVPVRERGRRAGRDADVLAVGGKAAEVPVGRDGPVAGRRGLERDGAARRARRARGRREGGEHEHGGDRDPQPRHSSISRIWRWTPTLIDP